MRSSWRRRRNARHRLRLQGDHARRWPGGRCPFGGLCVAMLSCDEQRRGRRGRCVAM